MPEYLSTVLGEGQFPQKLRENILLLGQMFNCCTFKIKYPKISNRNTMFCEVLCLDIPIKLGSKSAAIFKWNVGLTLNLYKALGETGALRPAVFL